MIERLVALSDGRTISGQAVASALKRPSVALPASTHPALRVAREQFECNFILKTLITHQWKIQDTAAALGIERTHLWKKMKRYGIRQG